MPKPAITQLPRFWRHLRYHRQILKHVRWTRADRERLTFYGKMIAPGDLVFDIGANMGNRSKIFRELGARVVAFEPQSWCAGFLAAAFAGDSDFTLDRSALSDSEGVQTMYIGEAHTLSTLDTDWISRMEHGGRFATHRWSGHEQVPVTTLDHAIRKYGLPAFLKIDVEGHEYSVLRGLHQPVPALSLEFASESLDNIQRCIDHLESLASCEYRLSLGESMQLEGEDWLDAAQIRAELATTCARDPLAWGDVYSRCNRPAGGTA
jgi:FkbM family methyltransferase